MWLYLLALLGLYCLLHWYWERKMVPNLQEKYVLITGCDTGFGNLLARRLDKRGLRVLATCLTQDGAVQLKATTSKRLQTVNLDVTSSDSVAAMAEWVKQQVGVKGLWGVVNNAGISVPFAPNEWLTKRDFQEVLDVNLLGLIDVTINLTPLVRKARGRIVNVSSFAGRLSPFGGPYCPSKYGVEAFSDSLRRELKPFGVKVILVEPGYFKTAITCYKTLQASTLQAWEQSSTEIQESYGRRYLDDSQKSVEEAYALFSSNLSLVINCMEHSLTALHPHICYSAGWDAKFIFLPLSYIPTVWSDIIFNIGRPKHAQELRNTSGTQCPY